MNIEKIATVAAQECIRQNVGLDRVAMLLNAYTFAYDRCATGTLPSIHDFLTIARIAEPMSFGRIRTTAVTFASGGSAASAGSVFDATARLFIALDVDTDASEFVKAFLSIHPLMDGNGRVGFVLYNWINGTMDDPLPLPQFFGDN